MSLPTLRTERLVLRGFALDDAPRVQQLAGAPEVASTTLNVPHPYEDGMAEAWIASHAGAWAHRTRLTLAITREPDGLIGTVSLNLVPTHRRAELGYWIGVPYWGQGFVTEAAAAVLAHGFGELGLHCIFARAFSRNPASSRVMRKLGMRYEGTLRQHVFKDGRFEDLECYAILEDEWRGR